MYIFDQKWIPQNLATQEATMQYMTQTQLCIATKLHENNSLGRLSLKSKCVIKLTTPKIELENACFCQHLQQSQFFCAI